MTDFVGISQSFINILKHLKSLPLDEVHDNIDASIGIFEEYIRGSETSTREE